MLKSNALQLIKYVRGAFIKQIIRNVASATVKDKYKLGTSAIVTGASTGIGLQACKSLLENGVKNILMSSATNVKIGEEEANKFRRKQRNCCVTYQKCDCSNIQEINDLFACGKELFGDIDIVFNNAGILREDIWEKMIDINFKGVVAGTNLGMKYMSKANGGKGGAIVNCASILGLSPMGGAPVYVGTKHAVIGFTRSMGTAHHFNASGVRVMALCPGVTETPLFQHTVKSQNALDKEAQRELNSLPAQHVCFTGACLIELLKRGETGSLWITENEECYEVCIPNSTHAFRKR